MSSSIRVNIFYKDFRFWFVQENGEYYVSIPNELISALDVFESAAELEEITNFPAQVKAVWEQGKVAEYSIEYKLIIPDDIFEPL